MLFDGGSGGVRGDGDMEIRVGRICWCERGCWYLKAMRARKEMLM